MLEVFSFLSNHAVSFCVDIFCFVLYVLIPTLYSDPIVALCLQALRTQREEVI